MTAIERHIEATRQSVLAFVNVEFDNLLEMVKLNVGFMNEMNATNGDYQVSFIAEAEQEQTPQIPTDAELSEAVKPMEEKAEVKELEKRFDLEKESETPLIPNDKWQNLCKLVIMGWEGKEVSKATVSASLIKQGFAISTAQEKHLEQLRGIRYMMLKKEIGLDAALDQDGILESEKDFIKIFALQNNLK